MTPAGYLWGLSRPRPPAGPVASSSSSPRFQPTKCSLVEATHPLTAGRTNSHTTSMPESLENTTDSDRANSRFYAGLFRLDGGRLRVLETDTRRRNAGKLGDVRILFPWNEICTPGLQCSVCKPIANRRRLAAMFHRPRSLLESNAKSSRPMFKTATSNRQRCRPTTDTTAETVGIFRAGCPG